MSSLNLSLNALHTFSVVAKELNFTVAASVLHISPSAVSHQMKLLEAQLGMSLFHRKSKGVTLTQEAKLLADHVNKGFNLLEFGIESTKRANTTERVVLAVIPSLLEHWLIPKLGDFYQQFPHIELQLIAQDQLIDFNRHHVHAHLHFGHGQYQGYNCTHLGAEWIYPVCSPNYSKELGKNAELLSYQHGIEDAPGNIDWSNWFSYQSINMECQPVNRGFSHVGHTLTAAKYGQGVALGWHVIASELIKQGALKKMQFEPIALPFSYFLVTPHQTYQSNALQSLLQWLQLQFADSRPCVFHNE